MLANRSLEPCIVLIMHRPLATAFGACVEHVLGAGHAMISFDVDAINDVGAEARRILEALPKDAAKRFFLLNDLYGATPYRVARQVQQGLQSQGKNVFLLTGTSMPMVLKALTDRAGDDFEAYATAIAQTSLRAAVIE